MLAYPEEFPNAALLMILDKIRGKQVETAALVHAGWNVLGFALGKTLKGPQVAWGGGDDSWTDEAVVLAALESGAADPEAKQALPWILLAKVAFNIIMRYAL